MLNRRSKGSVIHPACACVVFFVAAMLSTLTWSRSHIPLTSQSMGWNVNDTSSCYFSESIDYGTEICNVLTMKENKNLCSGFWNSKTGAHLTFTYSLREPLILSGSQRHGMRSVEQTIFGICTPVPESKSYDQDAVEPSVTPQNTQQSNLKSRFHWIF